MSLRLPGQEEGNCFFVTTSFYQRKSIGTRPGVFAILGESMEFCLAKLDARLLAYVFMPSHIHVVLLLDGDRLSGFMRDVKKYTAEKTLRNHSVEGHLWQPRYDRVMVWTRKVLKTKVDYIHSNPVKAELTNLPEEWYWSSAGDYYLDRPGPLRVWKEWWV